MQTGQSVPLIYFLQATFRHELDQILEFALLRFQLRDVRAGRSHDELNGELGPGERLCGILAPGGQAEADRLVLFQADEVPGNALTKLGGLFEWVHQLD